MPHTSTENLPILPLPFAANLAADPEPPDDENDVPPHGVEKPTKGSQPASDGPGGTVAPVDDEIIIKGT